MGPFDYDYYGAGMAGDEPLDIASLIAMQNMQQMQPQGFAQPQAQQEPQGMAQQILSARFQPNADDIGNAALAGVAGNTYVNPMDLGMKRLETAANLQKIQAQAKLYSMGGKGSSGGATMAIYQEYMKNNPDMDPNLAMSLAQKSAGQGAYYNNGTVSPVTGAPQAAGAMQYGKEVGGERAKLEYAAPIELQKARGEFAGKKEATMPKAAATMQTAEASSTLVGSSIKRAKSQSGAFTTGFLGSMSRKIPGSPAFDLSSTLDTIKANIGFDKLAQMRANSPTGGALGQVSDFENRMLQSVLANVEQSQSQGQFEYNLDQVDRQYAISMQNLRQAYENDYGNTQGFDQMFGAAGNAPGSGGGDTQITPEQAMQELQRRRGPAGSAGGY